MKTNTTIFAPQSSPNYVSMVDDYRRTKYFYFKKTINANKDIAFEKLCFSIQKSFKLPRELEVDLKFNLRVNGISTKHRISEFNLVNKEIEMEWTVDMDWYWMTFVVKNKILSKKSIIKFKQIITRDKTFFGIQDFVGVYIYRNNFKKNCKEIARAVKELILDEKRENF